MVRNLRATIARPGFAIALAAAIVLAASGLAGFVVWQNYNAAMRAGGAKALSSAQVVAAHFRWMIEASDQALRRIDTAIGEGSIGASANAVRNIADAVGDLPGGFQYSVYDGAGNLSLTSAAASGQVNIADRDYYQQLKGGQQMVISPRLVERLSREPSFVIARRLTRNNGFAGVASIAIPTRIMDEFWNSIGLGPHSTVSVVNTDGWVIARHPDFVQSMNIKATSPLFRMLPAQKSGTYYSSRSPTDGLSRIVGFRVIEPSPLIALSGVETNEVLELFWSTLELQLAFGLPVLLLLAGFAVWTAWLLHAYAARNLELEAAVERNHVLFREIHHRVKNNLQAVSSLIRLQPIPDGVRSDMVRRISAMVAVHEHIYRSDQFDFVEISPYLERLVKEVAATYQHNVEIKTYMQRITVDRDVVLPIGMIVNEVLSNAFKYAFDNQRHGKLSVELLDVGEGEAMLSIADDGPGMSDEGRTGMGSKLIGGFVRQVGGRYTNESGAGMTFTMHFPVRPYAKRAGDTPGA